jgi:hypothetical protein
MYVEPKCRNGVCKNYYRGFMVDLMYMIARQMRMLIRFYESPDGRYGSYDNATNTWNGMMGEVIKREVRTWHDGGGHQERGEHMA